MINILKKELLFSLSKEKGDFILQPFKGSGNGGQKRNKTMSACRIIHPASNTVSECQEERSYEQNKKKAFQRLIKKPEFKAWYKIEVAKQLGQFKDIDKEVDDAMASKNLKIETFKDNKWIEI